eukprot:PLAT5588.1.p1 GENE.PLAT5588.1~~PLAT5588.1.p1  ORF type:complete len:381 (-),score=84.64 PLAT5588.1:267-1313(-)
MPPPALPRTQPPARSRFAQLRTAALRARLAARPLLQTTHFQPAPTVRDDKDVRPRPPRRRRRRRRRRQSRVRSSVTAADREDVEERKEERSERHDAPQYDDMEPLGHPEPRRKRRRLHFGSSAAPARRGEESSSTASAAAAAGSSVHEPELDPIMLTPLTGAVFAVPRTNGTLQRYDMGNLIDYLLVSGDFRDPLTRERLSEETLRSLDDSAREAGLDKRSVLSASRARDYYAEERCRRDAIVGLERCCGDLVADMLRCIEGQVEDAELLCVVELFPNFSHLYNQLVAADHSAAEACMLHWQSYVRGPVEKPIVDVTGIQPLVLHFLSTLASPDSDDSALFAAALLGW